MGQQPARPGTCPSTRLFQGCSLTNVQLGSNDLVDRYLPGRVALPSAVQAVAAGMSHSACLLASGRLATFGTNVRGQLGAYTLAYVTSTFFL
jgi:alpha-tubulin suppressor-like RCC1 family protein